ncbi:SirB2 family protein [Gallaecimonas kandeliae]|uniref:SirB2 family protein n=1 Tax=Gallaecimonas kandeliae TaxID=3029055 RepID=UPI002648A1B6|nr:SirB2 family protein [Gallaecimonas kandeliae]WKE64598.1 SirB2 family protein [Gallaecimonas kandeliae]
MAFLYTVLKHLHVLAVFGSLFLLTLRFIMDWRGRDWRGQKVLRVLPRAFDGALLLSAFALCAVIGQYPFQTPWVTEKLLGLMAYVLLAVIALQAHRGKLMRSFALGGAYGWILFNAKLAITKVPAVLG